MNAFEKILKQQRAVILDGAFATELERKGFDLNDPLWSAKILISNPEAITAVHRDYLEAGADCIITASYQATFEGFMDRGCNKEEAAELIRSSVLLAKQARDAFWKEADQSLRPKPLVAASVGPYGAYLADGSEYSGNYKLDEEALMGFHQKRLHTLIEAGPDLLACETIPCLVEAKALLKLMERYRSLEGWMSFSAADDSHISSGEKVEECAALLGDSSQINAIGINCTAPVYVEALIEKIRKKTTKPIIVYPNNGDQYDPISKTWQIESHQVSYTQRTQQWFQKGARIIGGCCRTTPEDIAQIATWVRAQ